MAERRSGEVAVPLSAKKIFKRVVPTDMQTAVRYDNILYPRATQDLLIYAPPPLLSRIASRERIF